MAGTNLTRAETAGRARLVDVDAYQIELDLTGDEHTFASVTTVRFSCTEPGGSTWLDLIAPRVHEVTLNGTPLDVADIYDGYRIALPGLSERNEVRVVADAAYMNTGEGLHRFVDPVDDEVYLYSQFEVADARRVYACFEQPDLKATVELAVTAPAHWQVVSNSPTPGAQDVGERRRRWQFAPTPRVSTYFTALVAGPYHVVRAEHAGRQKTIPLGLFCRASLAEYLDDEALFDVTRRGFDFFEDVFGLAYPFEKYDQLFVPEFNAGAMENAACVTHREDFVFRSRVTDAAYERRAETILHEMAHMWFGDLVTMRWWDDLWLNESFATWASVLAQSEATRWEQAWTTFAVTEKLWALRQDQLPSTHPIAADIRDLDDVEVNFDGITYAKGASVLKQLVAYVGREEFLAGVRAYFDEHAWANSELGDLFIQLERQGGRDLATWGQQWLQTAGVNTLSPVVEVDESGTYTSVTIEQSAPDEHPTLRTHRMAIGLYDFDGRVYVRRDRIELDVEGERTEIPQLRGVAQPDLLLLNDDDLTFSKVRLDERSLASVVEHIDALPALPRALVWTAATDMLRDAELPAREYVDLVLNGLPTETSITVVQHVLRVARAAIETMSHPGNRLLLSSHWVISIRRLANEADPGSDLQLALARTWFAAARTPEQLEPIRKLLDSDDGGEVLPGLCVDTDLRWAIVQSLAATGVLDDTDIDAELERDNTAMGQRQAALARAAQPTADAKAAAWLAAVEADDLPNALLEATVSGFFQPDQGEVLRPYVQRYLDVIPRIWNERTAESAQTIVVGLFPRLLPEPTVARTVRDWLDSVEIPDSLRRLVTEGLADLDRALRAQVRDQQAERE
ncbi:MAG TPA: aminopeptidase N [Jiangellaceae bacterium]|nr:aminopeptidase N [Jiangellaceae bacterium]